YDALVKRYESIKEELERIEEKRLEQSAKKEKILEFIKELKQREGLITEFDEELWIGTVDKVVIKRQGKISFVFKDGMEVEWDI
ncbi:MAG: resolvase, partial [Caloramator sp.]|nr:resolvase [Caloramator sp.]